MITSSNIPPTTESYKCYQSGSTIGKPFQCADCSADDPQWASLNKGVLICSECCYVHRNLGRHVSQIRSLKKGIWDSNQLELMYVLYSNGSNNIWEHSLIDPQNTSKIKKKPSPKDPVLPTKENFIKAKYAQMAFTLRPSKDDVTLTQEDLNRQLWSCVRTAHVETTLRLLVLGADPNYADPERRNSPLHVAAKEGQALQVELLWIYGADAGQLNAGDLSPARVAKLENNIELAARLEELQFEVTNRLTMYLCGRRPDHSKQQYFLIPELIGPINESAQLRNVRRQLRAAPAHFFERIVQDVYDEVDRRETVAAWNATMQGMMQPIHLGNDQCVAVFLPPNPQLTAIRNQMRQKLAKCGVREFAMLIIDVLNEAKRRHFGLPIKDDMDGVPPIPNSSNNNSPKKTSITQAEPVTLNSTIQSDCATLPSDNRDYDEVAESPQNKSRTSASTKRSSDRKSDMSGNILQDNAAVVSAIVSVDDFLELKERMMDSESKLNTFQQTNTHVLKMLTRLQSSMDRLSADNVDLHMEMKKLQDVHTMLLMRRQPSPVSLLSPGVSSTNIPLISRSDSIGTHHQTCSSVSSSKPPIEPLHVDSSGSSYTIGAGSRSGRRHGSLTSPSSVYTLASGSISRGGVAGPSAPGLPPPSSASGPCRAAMHRNGSAPPLDYTTSGTGSASGTTSGDGNMGERIVRIDRDWIPAEKSPENMEPQQQQQQQRQTRIVPIQHLSEKFPEVLISETEILTRAIKLLLTDAKNGQLQARAPDHARSIALLINGLLNAIPDDRRTPEIESCLKRMYEATVTLLAKSNAPVLDIEETCTAAYEIAKAAKQLLVTAHHHQHPPPRPS